MILPASNTNMGDQNTGPAGLLRSGGQAVAYQSGMAAETKALRSTVSATA